MDSCIDKRIIVIININLIPFPFWTGIIDICKTVAAIERTSHDDRHTSRDCDVRKAVASGKCSIFDSPHSFRDRDALKATAISKCIILNDRHAIRDRITPGFPLRTANECFLIFIKQSAIQRTICAVVWIRFNFSQASAICECIVSNTRHTNRD